MPSKTTVPGLLARGAGSRRSQQRHDAQDECDGRHQDGPEASACGFHCGIDGGHPLRFELARELHDQDVAYDAARNRKDPQHRDAETIAIRLMLTLFTANWILVYWTLVQ